MLTRVLRISATFVIVLLVFLVGVVVGGHPVDTGLTQLPGSLRSVVLGDGGQDLSGQALDVLRDRYFKELDEEGLERGSVDALVASLDDPFTVYLDPDELARLRDRTNGQYRGVGLQVAQRGEQIVVTRAFPDGPADKAGLRGGDRIASVDGTSVVGKSLEEVVALIRGPDGTAVALGVVRPGDGRLTFDLERATIKLPVVESRVVRAGGERIGYVRLSQFTRGSADAVRDAVDELREQDIAGLVLDLRGDPGGLVDEAVAVGGVFLPADTVIAVTEGRRAPRTELRAGGDPLLTALPMVVLVDGGSASASEIVAGALQDQDRATLVGVTTFGKALVQSTVPLRDGGALKLTTAQYVTPDGRNINKKGLQPSVPAEDDLDTPRDEALQEALSTLVDGR